MPADKVIEVFWTGGSDSTFRIVQLSLLPVKVQPYYLSDNRQSEKFELRAIEEITEIIRTKPQTKCELLPLKYIPFEEKKIAPEISEAYVRVTEKYYLGTQYPFLSTFAKDHPGIELSIEAPCTPSHTFLTTLRYKKKTEPDIGETYDLDFDKVSRDAITLFQHFSFPLRAYTKPVTVGMLKDWGYKDVLDLTWFCHTPINGEPCGKCHPCQQRIEDGLKDRFSRKALFRYRICTPLEKLKTKVKKILKPIRRK